MEIGLNAINFFPGRMGGIEVYFRNLPLHLQQVDRENRYTVLGVRPNSGEFALSQASFRAKQYDCGRYSPGWLVRGLLRKTVRRAILTPLIKRLPIPLIPAPFPTARHGGAK